MIRFVTLCSILFLVTVNIFYKEKKKRKKIGMRTKVAKYSYNMGEQIRQIFLNS